MGHDTERELRTAGLYIYLGGGSDSIEKHMFCMHAYVTGT